MLYMHMLQVLDELLAVVRQRAKSEGKDPQQIQQAVDVAFREYDTVVHNENIRGRIASQSVFTADTASHGCIVAFRESDVVTHSKQLRSLR
jgi:hypothetical protein